MQAENHKNYPCPCCGFLTVGEPPPGTFEICDVCGWEDDEVQFDNPDFRGGANYPSLNEARLNYAKFGAAKKKSLLNMYVLLVLTKSRNRVRPESIGVSILISDVATDPKIPWKTSQQNPSRRIAEGSRDGVNIRVILDTRRGDIVTGHPIP